MVSTAKLRGASILARAQQVTTVNPKRDADFYYPLTELSWFKSMETAGIVK
jgi:hypothetical protein